MTTHLAVATFDVPATASARARNIGVTAMNQVVSYANVNQYASDYRPARH